MAATSVDVDLQWLVPAMAAALTSRSLKSMQADWLTDWLVVMQASKLVSKQARERKRASGRQARWHLVSQKMPESLKPAREGFWPIVIWLEVFYFSSNNDNSGSSGNGGSPQSIHYQSSSKPLATTPLVCPNYNSRFVLNANSLTYTYANTHTSTRLLVARK